MNQLITDNLSEIARLCEEYGIAELDLFGSATTDEFDPRRSDVDFIVELGGYEPGVARRYGRFARALEALLGRPVDLITEEQIQNPYFRRTVEKQRIVVYRRADREAVA